MSGVTGFEGGQQKWGEAIVPVCGHTGKKVSVSDFMSEIIAVVVTLGAVH